MRPQKIEQIDTIMKAIFSGYDKDNSFTKFIDNKEGEKYER